jgi:hypothetical protein
MREDWIETLLRGNAGRGFRVVGEDMMVTMQGYSDSACEVEASYGLVELEGSTV